MKVAALQMVSGTALEGNLRSARDLLEQAAQGGAELAVLPEYFCVMGARDTDKLALQEPFGDGTIQRWLAQAARELGLWIVGGTLPLSVDEPGRRAHQVRNSSLAFAPDGRCVARYDKIHLFRFDSGREQFDEARVLEAGRAPALFELPSRDGHVWRVGLSVCYDLRFPELYRAYAAQGADLLLVPSAFTYTTGQAHWELLLRARAVENLAWVVAPAQGGRHENGRRTWGHSMVVDPWGRVEGLRPEGAGAVLAELDAQRLADCRRQLPALSHRVL
ncbi:carbon-nitrogen hydrolase family protein [Ramlibacter sp. 2FC]|uniref:carbon-nitrogen hydrolase family protein n=1 Tax=Ramlibacter sp. 2FC TaxID=2502188 RepID=UPI0010F877ED|nr:carbon-nitrogen hydrolase family protein [Ramlibacter sp. 2FC]